MSLPQFNAPPYDHQLVAVLTQGTFLITRWDEEDAIIFYQLPRGKFAELPNCLTETQY